MAGAAASVPDSLHANLLIVAESGGAVVRPDYAEGDSSRLIWKCQGIGGEDRLLRSALQPLATTLLFGRQPPTPFCGKLPDFVHVFPGHNTSGHQMENDPGLFVGYGGDGFRCTQFG